MKRNTELLEQTMRHIIDHPRTHDQTSYFTACATPSCFAGWAIFLAGYRMVDSECLYPEGLACRSGHLAPYGAHAAELLGLAGEEAKTLFCGGNTREMLALMVKDLVNGDELKEYGDYTKLVRG